MSINFQIRSFLFTKLYFFIFLITVLICTVSCHVNSQTFELIENASSASCLSYYIVDNENNKVPLPKSITKSLECPALLDFTDDILTYMEEHTVKLYDLKTSRGSDLFTSFPDMDGISNPAWSADRSKIMFVIVNQQKKHGYKEMARIISLTLDNDLSIISKTKHDKPVQFTCGGICNSEPYVDFMYSDDKIKYKRNININDRPGEFEEINLEFKTNNQLAKTSNIVKEGPYCEVRKNGKTGLINSEGKLVVPFSKKIIYLGDQKAILYGHKADTLFNIDTQSSKVLPYNFVYVSKFHNGKALCNFDDKLHFIDEDFNVIKTLETPGDGVGLFPPVSREGVHVTFVFKLDSLDRQFCGLVNHEKGVIVPFKYNTEGSLGDNYWITNIDQKWGVVDFQDNVLIPFEYDRIVEQAPGKFFAIKQVKPYSSETPYEENFSKEYIDLSGKEYIDSKKYDAVFPSPTNSYYTVIKNKKKGIVDQEGKVLLPALYDEVVLTHGDADAAWYRNKDESWQNINLSTLQASSFSLQIFKDCAPSAILKYGDKYLILFRGEACFSGEQNCFAYDGSEMIPIGNFKTINKSTGVIIASTKDKSIIIKLDGTQINLEKYGSIKTFKF